MIRHWLALGRLGLLFIAFSYLVMTAGFLLRTGQEAGTLLASLPQARPSLQLDLPFTGINVALEQYTDDQRAAVLKRLRATGFGWVRQHLDWAKLEPEPGDYQWQLSDPIISSIRQSDLIPIIVLDGSPVWARGRQDVGEKGGEYAPPADPATFARFASAFAQRYHDDVRYYQVWDEPNITPHWGNRHIEPVGYAQLLIAASVAIRAADADAVIIAAALAPTQDRGHTAVDEEYFLQRLYAAGAAPFFDVAAAQPFGFGHSPKDSRQQLDVLNFQRLTLMHRTMVAAGDGDKPVIGARFGWNTRFNSPWSTVRPELQAQFAGEALEIGHEEWPWLIGLGWAIDQPDAPSDDPAWGFALTPPVTSAIQRWLGSIRAAPEPRTGILTYLHGATEGAWIVLLAAMLLCAWRAYAAFRLLPWALWLAGYRKAPTVVHLFSWAILITLYYSATWAPVIVICGLAAIFLIAAFPLVGLWLAAAALPFHHQHKELPLINMTLLIPPTHAVLLCLLPAFGLALRPRQLFANFWNWLAFFWLMLALLASINVWNWSAYGQGLIDFALAPVLLFLAVQVLVKTPRQRHQLLMALCAGGLLVATIGLFSWGQGGGTEADGVRRLVGPHFSPNHTALYLERCLFVGLGLAFASDGQMRKWWLAGTLLIGASLLLTGSRGALLLGVPIGAAVLVGRMWREGSVVGRNKQMNRKTLTGLLAVLLAVVVMAVWAYWDRLGNSATIIQRLNVWQTAVRLWRDFPLLGVAPGGYFWRFPAYIPHPLSMDPNLRHPHNIWLEYATIWGIAGLAWFGVVAAALWFGLRGRLLRQSSAQRWLIAAILAALAAAIAHAQVDAFGALADLAGWNWLVLAILIQSIGLGTAQSRPFRRAALADHME